VVQEELLANMSEPNKPTEYKPPASAEEEEQRFTAMLGKFLEEDDAEPTPTGKGSPPPVPAVSNPSSGGTPDISAQINAALDAREKERKTNDVLENLTKEVAALKTPKQKKWWEPWSLFSDS
jgi:hypothetical protein